MSLSRATRIAVVALSALFAASTSARAQAPAVIVTPTPAILDFEPLSTAAGCGDNTFTSYGGLTWTGWGAMNKIECGAADIGGPVNGYWNGARSGQNTGYLQLPRFAPDPFQTLMGSITNVDGFDLLDAWMTAAWSTGLTVHVDAYRGFTLVGSRDFVVDYFGPSHVHFNFINITSAKFRSSGGVPDYALGGIGNQLVMDDANIALYPPVPEPATIALVATGLLAIGAITRRRRRTA